MSSATAFEATKLLPQHTFDELIESETFVHDSICLTCIK